MKFAIYKFISSREQKSTFSIFTLDRGGPVCSAGPKKNIGQILILCHTYIYCVGVWEKRVGRSSTQGTGGPAWDNGPKMQWVLIK